MVKINFVSPTDDFADKEKIMPYLFRALNYFPELATETITVRPIRTQSGAASAMSNIWLNPDQISHHVVGHELTHLKQYRALIPFGEFECDVFTIGLSDVFLDFPPRYIIDEIAKRTTKLQPNRPSGNDYRGEKSIIELYFRSKWLEHASTFKEMTIKAIDNKDDAGWEPFKNLKVEMTEYMNNWLQEVKRSNTDVYEKMVHTTKLAYDLEDAKRMLSLEQRLNGKNLVCRGMGYILSPLFEHERSVVKELVLELKDNPYINHDLL